MAEKAWQNMSFREREAEEHPHGEFAADEGSAEGEEGEVAPGYIDLPFESGSADPQPLRYGDISKGDGEDQPPETEENEDESQAT
jgi:hypothetical protein